MSEISLIDPIKDTSDRLARIGHQVTATKRLPHGTQLKTSKKLSVIVFDTGKVQFQGIDARAVETKYYKELHRVNVEEVKPLPSVKPTKCVTFKRPKKSHPEFTVRCPIGKTEDGKWKNVLKIEAAFNELENALKWARLDSTHMLVETSLLWAFWYDIQNISTTKDGAQKIYEMLEEVFTSKDLTVTGPSLESRPPMLIYKRSLLNTTRYGEFQVGITAKGVTVNTIEECLNG